MPREDSAPSIGQIAELARWIDLHWQSQQKLDLELKQLANDVHAITLPDTMAEGRHNLIEPERMSSAEGIREVDLISSRYTAPTPISFIWTGSGSKTERQREEMQTGINELADQLNPPGDSPRDRERIQTVALGRCARIFLAGQSIWFDAPVIGDNEKETTFKERKKLWRRKNPVPIYWRDLPAEHTFPAHLSRIHDEAISWVVSSWVELVDLFGEVDAGKAGLPEERNDWYKQVTLITYANRDHVAWVVNDYNGPKDERDPMLIGDISIGGEKPNDNQIIRSIKHGLDTCPIRIIAGKTGGWKEPGIYWRSVLFGSKDLIKSADRRLSEVATSSKEGVLPTLVAYLRDASEEGAAAKIETAMKTDVFILSAGGDGEPPEKIEALHVPPPGDTSLQLFALAMDRAASLSGATAGLEGIPLGASQPAWGQSFQAAQAVESLAAVTRGIVAQDSDTASMLIRCVSSWGEDIELQRHSEHDQGRIILKHENIRDWEPLADVTYKPRVIIDKKSDLSLVIDVLERIGNEDSNIPLSPPYVLKNFLDIENPLEEFERAEKWRFLMSKEMRQSRMAHLLREAQVELDNDEGMPMAELESLVQQGVVPPQALDMAREQLGLGEGAQPSAGPNSNGAIRSSVQTTRQTGIPFERGQPLDSTDQRVRPRVQ